jgi:hypothetical protein
MPSEERPSPLRSSYHKTIHHAASFSAALGGSAVRTSGFRVIAHKLVRLYSRPGNDLTGRFLLIVEALRRLRSRSCIIDGEAVACRENGIASSSG